MAFHIVNGPNLNLLGIRETDIYGDMPFEGYLHTLRSSYPDYSMDYFQSNHEGAIIDYLQQVGFQSDGILLNAAGYTHTSIAIADTVKAISAPVVEIHISDLTKRETFRQHSYLTEPCISSIQGLGLAGYEEGLKLLIQRMSHD